MGSSGGDGGSGYSGMFSAATPMPDLPIAGKDSTIGDPYNYGKFQSFLPDIKSEGMNDSATGLRPDMFRYRSPNGVVDDGGTGSQIQDLRNQLAALQANQGSQGSQGSQSTLSTDIAWPGGRQRIGSDPIETWVNAS